MQEESSWDDFSNKGGDVLRTALVDSAIALSTLSQAYGKLQLPDAQMLALNLRMPIAENVEVQDFLDMARLNRLQNELDARQVDFVAKEKALALLPTVDLDATQRALQELMRDRHQVSSQPLPQIVQKINAGGGAGLGRMLGEIADIGLLFVNPTIIGTKIASLVGKGAKVANIAVKATQVAKTASKGVKIVQAAQLGKKIGGVPQHAIGKLSMLEMLSLGYWGELVGAMLGGGPRDETIVDPEAQAQQKQVLSEMDAQVRAARDELARNQDIANEQQLTGWELEQNSKEQQSLKADLTAPLCQTVVRQLHRSN